MSGDQATGYTTVGWASEATYGSEATPTTWFKTLGQGPRVQPKQLTITDESDRPSLAGLPMQHHPSHADVTLSMYLRGKSGAAGTAAIQGELLEACGWSEALDAGVDAVYTLDGVFQDDTNYPAVTVVENRWQDDGQYRTYKARGVRGNVGLVFEEGKYIQLDVPDAKGLYDAPASVASGSVPGTYDGSKGPMKVSGMTATFAGTSRKIKKATFNSGLEVVTSTTGTGSAAVDCVRLHRAPGSAPTFDVEFESVEAFEQFLAALTAETQIATVITCTDGTDTIALGLTIQAGDYTRTGAATQGFSVPCIVTSEPTLTFT